MQPPCDNCTVPAGRYCQGRCWPDRDNPQCQMVKDGTNPVFDQFLLNESKEEPCPEPEAPRLPGLGAMALGFVQSVAVHASNGFAGAPDDVYEARLRACETSGPDGGPCEQLILPDFRCGSINGGKGCGCWLKSKARWAAMECPRGKWPSTSAELTPAASAG